MRQKEHSQKKPSAALIIALVLFYILISAAGEDAGDAVLILVGMLVLLLPLIFGLWIFRLVTKKAKPQVHTHDRVDHSRDLKIDSRTGKAVNAPVRQTQPHSAQEHWKQQLDQLLANGTIDRAEYKAMMKRRF